MSESQNTRAPVGCGEYVLVPREPTREMIEAGALALCEDHGSDLDPSVEADTELVLRAALAAAPLAPERGPVAWSFELARSIIPETGEYTNWGPPQLSFTKPNVPEGSIRNLVALSPSPAHTGEELVRARETAPKTGIHFIAIADQSISAQGLGWFEGSPEPLPRQFVAHWWNGEFWPTVGDTDTPAVFSHWAPLPARSFAALTIASQGKDGCSVDHSKYFGKCPACHTTLPALSPKED